MNCANCGAAMRLMGARRYYFCEHCGSFGFPEQLDEGVRLVERPAGAAPCPVCRKPLARALLDDAHPVDYCENCRGVLLQQRYFAEVVERRRAWASHPPVAPEPLDGRELQRVLRCPACAGSMMTHPYYGPGNVVLQSCEPCRLIWLDHGELRQIVDAPGRDRGARGGPPAARRASPPAADAAPTASGRIPGRIDIVDVLFDLLG